MAVTACGVCLPCLDQGVRNWLAIETEDTAVNEDALADSLATVHLGHVVVDVSQVAVAEDRSRGLAEATRNHDEIVAWVALDGGPVLREVQWGVFASRRGEVWDVHARPFCV